MSDEPDERLQRRPSPKPDPERSNVAILPGFGRRHSRAMLESALNADLEDVVIIGWKETESTPGVAQFFFSSSMGREDEILWALEQAKAILLRP